MARRRGRRWERAALVLALAVAAVCVALLVADDPSPPKVDAAPATDAGDGSAPSQPAATGTTDPPPPGCAALATIRAQQEASMHLQELLGAVAQDPEAEATLAPTIAALDEYRDTQLPVISVALGELAGELPERRADAVLLRRFVAEVVQQLDAATTGAAIARALEEAFTRDDAERALSAIAGFVAYDYATCLQPL